MQDNKIFFAVDLGATSGRTIIGQLTDGKVRLEELTRFGNPIIHTVNHDYWDLLALYNEIVKALKITVERNIPIQSIGIDTWGCDFALIGSDGQLLSNPLSYRDPHTSTTMEQYFENAIDKETVYEKTGIQFMNFNSLFQLYQMRQDGNSALGVAEKILFIPDALSYLLTGKAICEYTVASTSQMLNPTTQDLDVDLVDSLGLMRDQFGSMTLPGTVIGTVNDEIQKIAGIGTIPVVAVAGHDTASAVAAVPAKDERFAYLSSGTWSLMGIESKTPIINSKSFERNFTNEGGIEGTTRFLKNICGMWIYERCRKEWISGTSHAQLTTEAIASEPFRTLINPDDPCFANPESMVKAIGDYCKRTHQPVPRNNGEYCRCIFDSLAMRYRQVFTWLQEFADFDITTLHIIGGGSMNDYLNQYTANSCGVNVLAGPTEGTALGNIMLQAKANGEVSDIWEMRRIIANSIDMKAYSPKDKETYDKAYDKYLKITNQ